MEDKSNIGDLLIWTPWVRRINPEGGRTQDSPEHALNLEITDTSIIYHEVRPSSTARSTPPHPLVARYSVFDST